MPDNSAYYAFLADPNQEVRRAELREFFGPNAETFLRAYDKLREDTPQVSGGRPKFRLFGGGFAPAAFFLGPVWFFYRKMWMFAWIIVALVVVLAFIPLRFPGLIAGIILGSLAHRSYVQHAIAKLTRLHASNAMVSSAMVQAEGGVSKPAGIISGVLFGILVVIGIAATIYLAMHGVDPSRL